MLKGDLHDGMTPENLVLPPVFGIRGLEVNRHERDIQIQKATEVRQAKLRELEVAANRGEIKK